jgi:hypothetical protein
MFYCVELCSYYARGLLRFLLVLGFLCFANEYNFKFGCGVLVKVFLCYVCEYDDNDNCRCQP